MRPRTYAPSKPSSGSRSAVQSFGSYHDLQMKKNSLHCPYDLNLDLEDGSNGLIRNGHDVINFDYRNFKKFKLFSSKNTKG